MEILINNIIDQAKYFLEAADEFFPFGCTVDQENNLQPLGAYFEIEYPTSPEVISVLEKTIKNGLHNKKYKIGAVGIDIFINEENPSSKISAIEVRIYTLTSTEIHYYKYFKVEKEYQFEKLSI